MTVDRGRAGRVAVLATLLLAAFNTRTVIAAVAPIADELRVELSLGTAALSLVGTLPPLCFAFFAIPVPRLARVAGLERGMGFALATITLGHVIRALAWDTTSFVLGTVVTLAGIGVANVLLPPLVRRHFDGRIGGVTALYVTAQSLGTGTPALLGVPMAEESGWRVALGPWAVVGAVGLLLWVAIVRSRTKPSAGALGATLGTLPVTVVPGQVWRSRIAWAIAALFAVSASHAYAGMAWLPEVVTDLAGVSAGEAGSLLALYGAIGVVPAIVLPVLASRVRNVGLLVHIQFSLLLIGYLGLLLVPDVAIVLWVVCIGVGMAFFALCIVLVNLRTRTHLGTVQLSGFVQGVGYSVGALGPLAFGLLHQLTDGWTASIALLAVTSVVAFLAGLVVRRPAFVEDEWHRPG